MGGGGGGPEGPAARSARHASPQPPPHPQPPPPSQPARSQRLGFYDPLRKETSLNAPAIKKWLAVGAQPSETVGRLLAKAMITVDE